MKKFFQDFLNSKTKIRIFVLLCFSIFLIIFFPAFHSNGLIVFGDLDFGFYSKNYINRIFPLWNDTWSTTNFFNSTRIFIVGIVHLISSFFEYNPVFFQKIMIFGTLLASFFGMFIYVFQILKFEKDSKKLFIPTYLILLISFLVGAFYALNPWSIMRIQHFYLLVGYAILPFILYEILYFSEYENVYKGKKLPFYHIVIASLLYIVAIGAVHYLFFIFFFIISWFFYNFVIFLFKKKYNFLWKFTVFYIIFGLLVLSLLMYWMIPFLGASFMSNVTPANLNTVELIGLFSRSADWQNILFLTSYWWSMINFESFGIGYWIGGYIIIFSVFILNIFKLKNKYVLFFLVWAVILVLASSGTHSFLADFYKYIVFDSPVSGKMGFIFRDPNKFVGLLALCYGILWGTGIAFFSSKLFLLRKKIIKEDKLIKKIHNKKLSKIRGRYFLLKNMVFIFIFSFISISIIAYSFYIKPFKYVFINNFYSSVDIPDEYKKLIEYEKNDKSNNKYFYLPRYESHKTPGYNFAIAKWNRGKNGDGEKPMGYLDISSSVKSTYHPAEGSTIYLPLFYNYIENYLDLGIGNNLAKYLSLVNIGKIVYHNDILGLENKIKNQLENLEKQKNIKQIEKFGFISIFKVNDPVAKTSIFYKNMFHFGGMKTLETLFSLDQYDYKKFANIFIEQDSKINNWYKYEKENDIVNIKNKDDLFMSYFGDKYFLKPFDFSHNYNPFFKWSVMRLDIPDWKRHLHHIGIKNFPWDFDLSKGLVFTYASNTVDLKSYENIYEKGKIILDTKDIIDISEYFSSNEDLVHISLAKTNKYDKLPSIKGNIVKGNSKNWMIAKLKRQIVKPNHPYTFQLVLSGKGVKNIHGKVKFLDENFKETGVDYVSSPEYVENFELIKFVGSFVTPDKTKYIDFQISSIQKPKKNTYWWIHNFKFRDLGEYKKKNILKTKYFFDKKGKYQVYARTFQNIKGGKIRINIEKNDFVINTKTDYINKFLWQKVGTIDINEIGEKEVIIDNIVGFNGLNVIAFVPNDKILEIEKKYENNSLLKSRQISTFEAEEDFEINGNIQSNKIKTDLSNGKSINLIDGSLKTNFNILRAGDYNFLLKLNPFTKKNSIIKIKIFNDNQLILKEIYRNSKGFINFKGKNIGIGKYQLIIEVKTTSKSIIETRNLGRAKIIRAKKKINKNKLRFIDNEDGCTFYEGVNQSQLKYYRYLNGNVLKVILNRGPSCSWVETIDNKLHKINEGETLLISYDLLKENTKKLHSRIEFFDENKKFIKYEFIYDHSIDKDNLKQHVEKLVIAPKKSRFFRFSFMQKQRQEFNIKSKIEISNFKLDKYYDLAGIDSVVIYDDKSHLFSNTNNVLNVQSEFNGKMDLNVHLKIKDITAKLYINTILGKGKILFNNKEFYNKNLVISGDIYDILTKKQVLDIVGYSAKDYMLKVKNKQSLVSDIFFIDSFKSKKDFLNTFELIQNHEKKLKNKKEGSIEGKTLQFSESYSSLWRIQDSKKNIDIEPIIINFFQNGYILKEELGNDFTIKFAVKKFMYIGYFVAIFSFLLIIYILTKYIKKRRVKIIIYSGKDIKKKNKKEKLFKNWYKKKL